MSSRPGYGPRIGGIIEDETGWWQIEAVDEELDGDTLRVVGVHLIGKNGVEGYRSIEKLDLAAVFYL